MDDWGTVFIALNTGFIVFAFTKISMIPALKERDDEISDLKERLRAARIKIVKRNYEVAGMPFDESAIDEEELEEIEFEEEEDDEEDDD